MRVRSLSRGAVRSTSPGRANTPSGVLSRIVSVLLGAAETCLRDTSSLRGRSGVLSVICLCGSRVRLAGGVLVWGASVASLLCSHLATLSNCVSVLSVTVS